MIVHLVWSGPVWSGPVWSGLVRSGPVRSGPVRSGLGLVWSSLSLVCCGLVRSGLVFYAVVWRVVKCAAAHLFWRMCTNDKTDMAIYIQYVLNMVRLIR